MHQTTAADRNKLPIGSVLTDVLPETGRVLEIASGTGEHVIFFAQRFPHLVWQPSDPDPSARNTISAKLKTSTVQNVLEPSNLNVQENGWPKENFNALVCINMVHISPWEATIALFKNAKNILSSGSPLVLYGPYLQLDVPTAPTNIAFNQSLRKRNPLWGLRKLNDVSAIGARNGFVLEKIIDMPANNLSLVFRRP